MWVLGRGGEQAEAFGQHEKEERKGKGRRLWQIKAIVV